MTGLRDLARLGPGALAWLAALIAGSLATWVGGTIAALWLASRAQELTGSFGLAVLALLVAGALILALALRALAALTRGYQRRRVARGLDDTGGFPLEVTLVCTAIAAGAGFVLWFFLLAGSPLIS